MFDEFERVSEMFWPPIGQGVAPPAANTAADAVSATSVDRTKRRRRRLVPDKRVIGGPFLPSRIDIVAGSRPPRSPRQQPELMRDPTLVDGRRSRRRITMRA